MQTKMYWSVSIDKNIKTFLQQYLTDATLQNVADRKGIQSLRDIFLHDSLGVADDVDRLQLIPDNVYSGFFCDGSVFETLVFLGFFPIASFLITSFNALEVKNDQYAELDCDERIELMKIKLRLTKKLKPIQNPVQVQSFVDPKKPD